jgi:hypothetical protein
MEVQPTSNNGGVYKAWLSNTYDPNHLGCPDAGFCHGFPESASKTDNFKCVQPPPPPGCDDPSYARAHPDQCPSPPPPSADIFGYKYYDANTDGVQDNGEAGIPGWQIKINPSAEADVNGGSAINCTYTDGTGLYDFIVDPLSNHDISEGDPLGPTTWLHTTATTGNVSAGGNGTSTAGPSFGNVCVGAGNGLTLGYWSNKNGQAAMGCTNPSVKCTTELNYLSSLNLVDGFGNHKSFSNYADFRSWILGATATNMAYMLSAQLAAMELNTRDAKPLVSGGSLVYSGTPVPACFGLGGEVAPNNAGFISISNLMNDANIELGAYPNTTAPGTPRDCQQYKKNALDNANNSLNFVQSDQSKCPAFNFDTTGCQ